MHHTRTIAFLAAMTLSAGQAAHAMSADDVWEQWQADFSLIGLDLTAEAHNRENGHLHLKNPSLSGQIAGRDLHMTTSHLVLHDRNDHVAVDIAGLADILVSIGNRDMRIATQAPDASLNYSMQGETMARHFDAPKIEITADLQIPGETDSIDLRVSTQIDAFLSHMTRSQTGSVQETMTSDAVQLLMRMEDGEDALDLSLGLDEIDLAFDGRVGSDAETPLPFLMAGTFTYSLTGLALSQDGDIDDFGHSSLRMAMLTGQARMDHERFSLEQDAKGIVMEAHGFGIPDADIAIDRIVLATDMPLAAPGERASTEFALSVDGLGIGDDLWALLDPDQALGQDTLDFAVDFSAEKTWAADTQGHHASMPAVLNALTLSDLMLDFMDVSLRVDGALDFASDARRILPGVTMPEGGFHMQVAGFTALLARMQQAGLIGANEIAGAMMMLNAFGEEVAEDTFATRLEIMPDGSVNANGLRVR